MFSWELLGDALVLGVLVGCFYAAVSIGLSISFGLLDVPNVAHPALLVLASYGAWLLGDFDIDPIVAGLLLMPPFFVLGVMLYRTYHETFEKRGSDAGVRGLAFFFGIAFIIEVGIIMAFGVDQRTVQAFYIGKSVEIFEIRIPMRMVVAFAMVLLLSLALTFYLSKTFLGRAIRAVAQDEGALRLMGADPVAIKQWAFGIATAVVALAGFIALAFAMALTIRNEYAFFAGFVVLQFIVLATAWNILGGYAGYVNFGTSAFFGVGVYTAVFLLKAAAAPLWIQIGVAALVGAALGLGVGLLTLRLRGIFFSIATVAITIIAETLVTNWKFVGGATGVQLLRPPVTEPFDSYIKMLFVIAAVLARHVQNSGIGRGLRAIRDDEIAAECSGVPTLNLKLVACALSGALMCAAGAPSAMYLQFADPVSAFNLNYSVSALAMSLIGGTSHWIGPVLGAILLATTQQLLTVTISSEVNVLVLGVMLVLFVVVAPEGIIGLARKVWRLVRRGSP